MLSMQESIVIDQPRKRVWDYATDPARRTLWMTNVLEYEAEREGPPEPDDRARVVSKLAGRRIESADEVTEAVPGESYAFKSVDGPFDYAFTFRFEDADDGGTRLTIRGESPGLGGVFGKLGDPLVVRMFSRDVRANLENLKTLMEAD
jgi:uncharacterized protein YndB with AHSA1/START domain